jgi:hypothetical protein
LPAFAAISEALNYDSFLEDLSNLRVSTDLAALLVRVSNQLLGVFSRALNSIPVFFTWSTHPLFFLPLFRLPPRLCFRNLAAAFSRARDYSTHFLAHSTPPPIFSLLLHQRQ